MSQALVRRGVSRRFGPVLFGVVVATLALVACSDPAPPPVAPAVASADPAATTPAEAAAPAAAAPAVATAAPPASPIATEPEPGSSTFVNSPENLDGTLAENYVDFSFSYPPHWTLDPESGKPGASNFAKVTHDIDGGFTVENFAVGWFGGTGTVAGDAAVFPTLAAQLSSQFEPGFPGYRKISEGPTRVGAHDGYELRFESTVPDTGKGTLTIWARAVMIPGADSTRGVTLVMMATNLSPDVRGIDDVGVKGELPAILASFTLDD